MAREPLLCSPLGSRLGEKLHLAPGEGAVSGKRVMLESVKQCKQIKIRRERQAMQTVQGPQVQNEHV